MSKRLAFQRERLLQALETAVKQLVAFFKTIPEDYFDGHLTAHEVVAHLVFWHEEYASILTMIGNGCQPTLRSGSFANLNTHAIDLLGTAPYYQLLQRLQTAEKKVSTQLHQLSSWNQPFPIKKGGPPLTVYERVSQITNHLTRHTERMKRARRHGSDWVNAYFMQETA